eukprot:1516444-Prymnesium_polylepis.2
MVPCHIRIMSCHNRAGEPPCVEGCRRPPSERIIERSNHQSSILSHQSAIINHRSLAILH